ncbi:hypothetical protein AMAG_00429 [Allomyces macrogynus ATCC 38327]|uniref:Uncharacterized protein n=1 Tax=Allomyces macrogynus (strain ATCC 38327) TaxID=578462 RepID=A0A0L0RWI8_ALLM3|nr:hypothetical protein AMAG_00429 [Allomyces macrogynus ATCC 38327]|eukprot:KNE54455.1 hypothetical protein AMAG_00429 [Allomyces macrogynus ATCC 38327]
MRQPNSPEFRCVQPVTTAALDPTRVSRPVPLDRAHCSPTNLPHCTRPDQELLISPSRRASPANPHSHPSACPPHPRIACSPRRQHDLVAAPQQLRGRSCRTPATAGQGCTAAQDGARPAHACRCREA